MSAIAVELRPEQALAQRWLRQRNVPLVVWQWLSGRAPEQLQTKLPRNPTLESHLSQLGIQIARESNSYERDALERSLAMTSSLLCVVFDRTRGPFEACHHRMLAASLLPLYRGLAKGSVTEVTSVMRRQLADALTLAVLVDELGSELAELLASSLTMGQSPYELCKASLGIDLECLSQHLLCRCQSADVATVDNAVHRGAERGDVKIDWRPDWAKPSVLWRLSAELSSERSEFVVPREWISVPVPWNEASEHWRSVLRLLQTSRAISASEPSMSQLEQVSKPAPMEPKRDISLELEIARSVESLVSESRQGGSLQKGMRQCDSRDSQRDSKPFGNSANPTVGSRPAPGVAPTVDLANASVRPIADEFVVPKIIIAEVRSHNDPVFVSLVRRQLAICRSESRTLSLIAARVQPDGESDSSAASTLSSLGLSTWQQKLVNWMSDHPEVHEPYAFVSGEGELIVCLLDIERSAATGLLRQGLVEVLTGKALTSELGSALAKVAIPAKYHSGIGTVSSPGASFEAEQLIEATYRCLDAAERHGKASIKSIEVY